MTVVGNDWDEVLSDYFESKDYAELISKAKAEYEQYTCYPPKQKIFSAFRECPFKNVKVVIIGQDPYHNPGEADGKCFSTSAPKLPPSLVNILEAIENDYKGSSKDGNLSRLAKQGVLLLNTYLSVRENQPLSHSKIGWDKLVHRAIEAVNAKGGVVFMLWGSHARGMVEPAMRRSDNLYLESVHPSPLSAYRGFLTCGHFKKANTFLYNCGEEEIIW